MDLYDRCRSYVEARKLLQDKRTILGSMTYLKEEATNTFLKKKISKTDTSVPVKFSLRLTVKGQIGISNQCWLFSVSIDNDGHNATCCFNTMLLKISKPASF